MSTSTAREGLSDSSEPRVGTSVGALPEGDAQVSCRDVWKVFGPNAAKVIGSGDVDLSRAELMAKSGSTVAVRDVSFEVRRGEVFVVMGLSGSGKSTLVRCIIRLVEPTAGAISICGQDVLGADPKALRELRRTKIAMVFQHFGLFPHRTVIDNVAYGLEVRGIDKVERHARARELLNVVGLSAVEGSYPDQLSGGMQQRVGLARALAVDPEVLIFDEAFSALDPLIRREMQDEVIRLQGRLHKTVLFVTHDLDEALKLGDRIAIMKDGRFVQVGSPAEIVGAPADDYVREFVRDVPRGKVLTAAFATRPHAGGPTPEHVVPHDQRLGELLPAVFGARGPIGVVDASGEVIGILDRRMVIHVLAGREEPNVPEEPAFELDGPDPA
jgi:glycine betaine/proline transport system ATP-binding protein